MTLERRRTGTSKSTPLPIDFLNMVTDVFGSNFEAGLKKISEISGKTPHFLVRGNIYKDEVLLIVSLSYEGNLTALSAYASCDFDPKASAPTPQDLLGACVDAVGAVFTSLFETKDPAQIEEVADLRISSFEDLPKDWTKMDVEKRAVFLRVDRANPAIDEIADAWLDKNDPEREERERKEQEKVEKLFVTGPKDRKPGGSSGLH